MYNVTSCIHCCSRKAVSITYSECVFVALGTQHAMSMGHIVMCPALLYNITPHYLINCTIFGKKIIEHKIVFRFSLQLCSKHFLFR